MPEYLAPGVYVEETSFRAKSIEGVSTTTTGFVGPTRFGPTNIEPDIITSLVEFERTYGGRERLSFDDGDVDNYMWHAARAFFEEGGKRLYVSRIYKPADKNEYSGHAQHKPTDVKLALPLRARFPGESGNGRVTFSFKVGQNILVRDLSEGADGTNKVRSLLHRDIVLVRLAKWSSPPESPPVRTYDTSLGIATWDNENRKWSFKASDGSKTELASGLDPRDGDEIRIVTVSVAFDPALPGMNPFFLADLPIDPDHQRAGAPDSLFAVLSASPANLGLARTTPIMLDPLHDASSPPKQLDGLGVISALRDLVPAVSPPVPTLVDHICNLDSSPEQRSITLNLTEGSDGELPAPDDYKGSEDVATGAKSGLLQFEDIEDISIVAAPGSTFNYEDEKERSQSIVGLLLSHAERMRYRIAVVDCGSRQTVATVRDMRARFDSKYGAFYYPWVRTIDPLSQREIHLPPSGFVAGIYARNDINRAVFKAPANEVVNLAIGFEQMLNKAQQEVLNPEGINCFRFFEGRGMRLWGARTMSSDPEWKYVNIRRYFAYLERSIDKGTQWAVFEPNGEQLWANVRRTIEDFLLNEWQGGALLGEKPERSFFVKCDRSTMSQNDLDNGRLICLIGVAALKPAEFVIFRIGQWTADRKI